MPGSPPPALNTLWSCRGRAAEGRAGSRPQRRCRQLPGTDRQTVSQTDRRGQAAAIPAPPARKNSRRLDLDQVFPQALFDMNIKGASQIPSAVRGLENPCRRASGPSSPMRRARPALGAALPAPGTSTPLRQAESCPRCRERPSSTCTSPPSPEGTRASPAVFGTGGCSRPAPGHSCKPRLAALGAGKERGCVGLEAGAGRGFRTAARGGGARQAVSRHAQPTPAPRQEAPPADASSAGLGAQPGAALAFPFPAPWAKAPALVSFLPSPPSQAFVPRTFGCHRAASLQGSASHQQGEPGTSSIPLTRSTQASPLPHWHAPGHATQHPLLPLPQPCHQPTDPLLGDTSQPRRRDPTEPPARSRRYLQGREQLRGAEQCTGSRRPIRQHPPPCDTAQHRHRAPPKLAVSPGNVLIAPHPATAQPQAPQEPLAAPAPPPWAPRTALPCPAFPEPLQRGWPARTSPLASQGPCPRPSEAPPSDQTLC